MANRKKNVATPAEAKALRSRQTEGERILLQKLRAKQLQSVKFRRQQPIGPYIVDFVSFDENLIIEIDGGQHNFQTETDKDKERTQELEKRLQGYQILE